MELHEQLIEVLKTPELSVVYHGKTTDYFRTHCMYHTPIKSLSLDLLQEQRAVGTFDVIPEGFEVELYDYSYSLKTLEWAIWKEVKKQKLNYRYLITGYKAVVHVLNMDHSIEIFEVTFNSEIDFIVDEEYKDKLSEPYQGFNFNILKTEEEYEIEIYDCYPVDDPGYVFDTYLHVKEDLEIKD